MTDITIPREAWRAVKAAVYDLEVSHEKQHIRPPSADEIARAACLAMIKAWPGMELDDRWSPPPFIHLPLAQENGKQFDQKEDQQRMWDIAAEVSRHGESGNE